VVAPVQSPYLLHAMAATGADDYVVAGTPDAHLLDRLGGRTVLTTFGPSPR
jgi:hypothetical protein